MTYLINNVIFLVIIVRQTHHSVFLFSGKKTLSGFYLRNRSVCLFSRLFGFTWRRTHLPWLLYWLQLIKSLSDGLNVSQGNWRAPAKNEKPNVYYSLYFSSLYSFCSHGQGHLYLLKLSLFLSIVMLTCVLNIQCALFELCLK